MEMMILGSVLLFGGLLSLSGLFDGKNDDEEPEPDGLPTRGDDDLTTDHGELWALAGDDTISASNDAIVHGDLGRDEIRGSDDVTAYGGSGQDSITVTDNVTAYGGKNGDSIWGQDDTTLYGGGGTDELEGRDNALLFGNGGNDSMTAADNTIAYGGFGDDRMTVDGMEEVDQNNAFSTDTNTSLHGGMGNDTLTGAGNDSLFGGFGEDELHGYGATEGQGGVGNDNLFAHGQATMWGGAGDDDIRTDIHGSDGPEAVVYGEAGNDVLMSFMGQAYGGAGDDMMYGNGADDLVQGGGPMSDVSLFGGGGDDDMVGANGVYLYGNSGDDNLELNGNSHGEGGWGDDTLLASEPFDLGDSFGEVPAYLSGGEGNDHLIGSATSEMYGGNGNDILTASSYENAFGGDGDDRFEITASEFPFGPVLKGMTLTGGGGTDDFNFSPQFSSDSVLVTITDFDPVVDHLAAFDYTLEGNTEAETAVFSMDSVTVTPASDGSYVDVTFHWTTTDPDFPVDSPLAPPNTVIRLMGHSSFDTALIQTEPEPTEADLLMAS